MTELDDQRARWLRWREALALADPLSAEFGSRSFGASTPQPARLIVVPADPESHLVEFDGDFWQWWATEISDPATEGQTSWGTTRRPTALAAICGREHTDDDWWRYLALHRCAALDAGLGQDMRVDWREDQVFFRLTAIVARMWAAFSRYCDVIARYSPAGPFEVALALRGTEGSQLAGFGEGWAEPGQGFGSRTVLADPNLLLRREVAEWPSESDAIRELVFSIGSQLEDAWGVDSRRFLAHRGDFAGQFDARSARWQ